MLGEGKTDWSALSAMLTGGQAAMRQPTTPLGPTPEGGVQYPTYTVESGTYSMDQIIMMSTAASPLANPFNAVFATTNIDREAWKGPGKPNPPSDEFIRGLTDRVLSQQSYTATPAPGFAPGPYEWAAIDKVMEAFSSLLPGFDTRGYYQQLKTHIGAGRTQSAIRIKTLKAFAECPLEELGKLGLRDGYDIWFTLLSRYAPAYVGYIWIYRWCKTLQGARGGGIKCNLAEAAPPELNAYIKSLEKGWFNEGATMAAVGNTLHSSSAGSFTGAEAYDIKSLMELQILYLPSMIASTTSAGPFMLYSPFPLDEAALTALADQLSRNVIGQSIFGMGTLLVAMIYLFGRAVKGEISPPGWQGGGELQLQEIINTSVETSGGIIQIAEEGTEEVAEEACPTCKAAVSPMAEAGPAPSGGRLGWVVGGVIALLALALIWRGVRGG